MNIDLKNIGKAMLPIGALVLSFASTIVSNKVNEKQMESTIAEKVAEALANQTKGS